MRRGHVPVRTCRGCGRQGTKTTFIRMGIVDGALIEDQDKQLAGKGIYCCDQQECRVRMTKKLRKVLRPD